MFTRLAKFRLVQSRRAAPGPRQAFTHSQTLTHSNDNLPGFRRPEGRRRIPTPALACHWLKRNGRLECRWQLETSDDAPLADADTNAARQAACQGGISHNGLRTVLSGTGGWNAAEHCLPWATGKRAKNNSAKKSSRIF
jgi:hypothetical protein